MIHCLNFNSLKGNDGEGVKDRVRVRVRERERERERERDTEGWGETLSMHMWIHVISRRD